MVVKPAWKTCCFPEIDAVTCELWCSFPDTNLSLRLLRARAQMLEVNHINGEHESLEINISQLPNNIKLFVVPFDDALVLVTFLSNCLIEAAYLSHDMHTKAIMQLHLSP